MSIFLDCGRKYRRSRKKSLAIVVRYSKNCLAKNKFATLLQFRSSRAEYVASDITFLITENKTPIENFLSFEADNVSVLMGNTSGVATSLKQKNSNLIVMGCVCHSFNLCSPKTLRKTSTIC